VFRIDNSNVLNIQRLSYDKKQPQLLKSNQSIAAAGAKFSHFGSTALPLKWENFVTEVAKLCY
jgi:hypothetical protein